MIKIFAEIQEDFDNLKEDDFIEPSLPFDRRKYVSLGGMSEELKKLFTLLIKAKRATKDWEKKFEMAEEEEDESKAAIEANKAVEKERSLEGAFWNTVFTEYPFPDKPQLFVTKGFRVVYEKGC